MNYIDVFFILVFVLTVLTGYLRGFAVSLISLLRFAIAVPLAFYTSSKYSYIIYQKIIQVRATELISEKVNSTIDFNSISASIRESADSLPFVLKNSVDLSFLEGLSSGSSDLTSQIVNNIVEPVAIAVIKIIIFVLTIVLFYVITWIIILLVKKIGKAENAPFKKTNKFLGAVFGLVKSVILIFTVAAVFEFIIEICGSGNDNSFVTELKSSEFLYFINGYNPILYVTGQL